ncbi:glycosyltransferase [Luteolibacter pohnpeiensis]|uniref:Glycosyltransferase n=1 Tax=Luteolibacter pohnpeiensis TaxID=454153 RepID=A0A934SA65_9BACT|nr:glycosyltransferase [Luteolibacter pohnpeiensis]MBK1882477.1 glycosyltransferase [Luteolibacter pohnpeiensis]
MKTKSPVKILIIGRLQGANRGEWVSHFLAKGDPNIKFNVKFSPLATRPRQNALGYIADFLLKTASFVVDYIQGRGTTIIYVPPMNYSIINYAWALNSLLRSKLIVDYYVCALPTLEEDGGSSCWIGNDINCIKFDRAALSKADILIHPVISELKLTASMAGVELKNSKIRVLPLTMDRLAHPKKKLITRKLRIAWWALFSPLHGLDQFLRGMEQLSDADLELIELTLIGSNTATPYVKGLLEAHPRAGTKIKYRTDLSFSNGTLPSHLVDHCDLALGHFGLSRKSQAVISNKIVEALAIGLPVFTGESSGVREFLNDDQIIFVDLNPEAIAAKLRAIVRQEICLDEIAENGSSAFDVHFSRETFVSNFRELILSDRN